MKIPSFGKLLLVGTRMLEAYDFLLNFSCAQLKHIGSFLCNESNLAGRGLRHCEHSTVVCGDDSGESLNDLVESHHSHRPFGDNVLCNCLHLPQGFCLDLFVLFDKPRIKASCPSYSIGLFTQL